MKLYPLLFLLLLWSCQATEAEEPVPETLTPQPWSGAPRYYSVDGKKPVLLLGFDCLDSLPQPAAFDQEAKMAVKNGANVYRLALTETEEIAQLKLLTDVAARRGLFLQVRVRDSTLLAEAPRANHVLYTVDSEVPYRPAPDQRREVGNFNRAVLAGLPVVTFPRYSRYGLNAIRGVRIIQDRVKFWELQPAPKILGATKKGVAYAASDREGNYVIYLPTSGTVEVELPEAEQVRRKVTVVGFLGTQRSEVLEPPYDELFSLTSNEVRGGWLLITRL